jgi:toxin ParE1/3/4
MGFSRMTKRLEVFLLDNAEKDIDELYRYVKRHDSAEKAERLSQNVEQAILNLHTSPLRGHYPPELKRLGVLDYREVFFKPYRIIYEVAGASVFIHCVLDGRRDFRDILQQRLLR